MTGLALKRYNTIRWRAFGAMTLLLLASFAMFWLVLNTWSERHFEREQNGIHDLHHQQFHRLIDGAAQRMTQMSNAAALDTDLMQAIIRNDLLILEQELNELDWNLQVDAGIEILALYNANGQRLRQFSDAHDVELARQVLRLEQPLSAVQCLESCRVISYNPLLHEGSVVGVLALTEVLSNIMLRFQQVSDIDLALLAPLTSQSRAEQSNIARSWGLELAAITQPARSKKVLERVASVFSPAVLAEGVRFSDADQQVYHLKMLPLENRRLLFMSNISDEYAQLTGTRMNTVRWSLACLVVAEILLLLLLSYPLQRVARTEKALSLLSGGRYRELAQLLNEERVQTRGIPGKAGVLEEAGELAENNAALEEDLSALRAVQATHYVDSVLFTRSSLPMLVADENLRLIRVNPYLLRLLGMSSVHLSEQTLTELLHCSSDKTALEEQLKDLVAGRVADLMINAQLIDSDGMSHGFQCHLIAFTENDTGERRLMLVGQAPNGHLNDRHRNWLEKHDAETGCLNRSGLQDALSQWPSRAERLGVIRIHLPLGSGSYGGLASAATAKARQALIDKVQAILEPESVLGRIDRNDFLVLNVRCDSELDALRAVLKTRLETSCREFDLSPEALVIRAATLETKQPLMDIIGCVS